MEMPFSFLVSHIEVVNETLGAVQTPKNRTRKEKASVEMWGSAALGYKAKQKKKSAERQWFGSKRSAMLQFQENRQTTQQ